MALHTINEGMYVKVAPYKGSTGGVGVVKKKKRRLRTPEEFAAVFAAIHATGAPAPSSPPRFQFDIKYTGVETRLTQDVSPSRVASYSFSTTARKRGGQATATRPSLLSTSHQPIHAPPAPASVAPKPLTSQSARAPVTELEGKVGVTEVSHKPDVVATTREPVVSSGT
jgi:hypothetical protein